MPSNTPGLIILGLNHKTAPLDLRERVAFTPQGLPEALLSLHKLENVEEAAIISTCNRTELYCSINIATDSEKDNPLINWLSQFHGMDASVLSEHLYIHDHKDSIRHAMEVASGLDSMVLGEPQIAGQMKDAYAMANKQGTLGPLLGKLFQHAFAVSKQVRTDTSIGSSPVSVAFAAVSLAKQIFAELDKSTVLLIGAGETIELTARHLHSQNIKHMIVANRSLENAQKLATEYDAEAIRLQHIGEHLHRADIVIASTASPLPVLGKGTVERALKARKREPIFMVDLAVPRDVEPEVNTLDDVYLYTVDDLQGVIDENLESRMQAAEQAREIINEEVNHFINWQHSLGSVDIISELRASTQALAQEVLDKALKQLSAGQPPQEVLEYLTHTLTNKFLHRPCISLRQASQDNETELLRSARKLLLDQKESGKKQSDKKGNSK
jgi:glutamyl-tRNA reductase